MNTQRYTVWLTIAVTHPYFKDAQCGLTLSPTAETLQLLGRAGMLFRQQDACTWLLIRPEGEAILDDRTQLVFDIRNTSPEFYYYTENELHVSSGYRSELVGENGVWQRLTVPFTAKRYATPATVKLTLENKAKFWEFLVIPRYAPAGIQLKLREDKDRLTFDPAETVDFVSEKQAVYRFVTTAPVPLQQAVPYRFSLLEVKPNGENLLSTALKIPHASSVSRFSAKDTITSYFYL